MRQEMQSLEDNRIEEYINGPRISKNCFQNVLALGKSQVYPCLSVCKLLINPHSGQFCTTLQGSDNICAESYTGYYNRHHPQHNKITYTKTKSIDN